MTSIFSTILLFFLTVSKLISAAPNVTAIPIAPGTCQGFPGYVPQPIGELTQQFFFEARDTPNSSLDGLRSSLQSSPSSPSSSSSSQLIINTDPTVVYNIFTCANGSISDIHGGPNLVFSVNEQDQELGYQITSTSGKGETKKSLGPSPEVYTHEIAGVQQDGLFLGWGNVTTWAFQFVSGVSGAGGSDYYRMRLLGSRAKLKDGELDGFVRIVAL